MCFIAGAEMGRDKDIGRHEELLSGAVAYALKNGLTDLSLRPLATELGTSARMLIHHFGSRDALVSEILAEIEARLAEQFAQPGSATVAEAIALLWRQTGSKTMQRLLRSSFEVWGRALVRPGEFISFLSAAIDPWRELVAQALVEEGWDAAAAKSRATMIVGSFTGLQLMRLSGAHKADVDAAVQLLIDLTASKGG
jgi:AcrR family transcriptional regulator